MRSLFLFDFDSKGSIELLVSCAFRDQGIPHGFTSRQNNFGARNNGPSDRLALLRELGIDACVTMRQVHGSSVVAVKHTQWTPKCDGVMTERAGLGLVVSSADCAPILLWASDVNVVAAVHAGWRGTLTGVTAKAIHALVSKKCALPSSIHAVIGPAIRSCCFEVGDDVVEAFSNAGREVQRISCTGPEGRKHLDIVAENRYQLIEKGVPSTQIYDSGYCTYCENGRFYSYRREGKDVGRIMGVIAVK